MKHLILAIALLIVGIPCDAKEPAHKIYVLRKGILPLLGTVKILKDDSIRVGSLGKQDLIVYGTADRRFKLGSKQDKKHELQIDAGVQNVYVMVSYNFLIGMVVGNYPMRELSPEQFKELYQKKKWVRRSFERKGMEPMDGVALR